MIGVCFSETGGYGKARDLVPAERHSYPLICQCGISLPISGSRGSEINIDGLPGYRMGESDDIEEIEFFTDSEDES